MLTPSAPRLRQVLALLVLRRREVVSTDVLVDELWGMRPPRHALRALHTCLYDVRRAVRGTEREANRFLVTEHGGYRAVLPDEAVDVGQFEQWVEEGQKAVAGGEPLRARELLERGLALWRGAALADVRRGEVLRAHAVGLEEARLRALELRLDCDLELGRHGHVVAELTGLVAGQPFHEGLSVRLMTALYRSGRRWDALAVYRDLRNRLRAELGAEPGPEARRTHRAVLTDDPALSARAGGPARLQVRVRPAQLPPDTVDFTGRAETLARVAELAAVGRSGSAAPVACLMGMPGVGKTATAVHAAHLLRENCPDGQFYVQLADTPTETDAGYVALGRLLRSTGMPSHAVPDALPERVAAFRSWSSARRVLVLVDGAGSARQVKPLLPAGPGSLALVTSRSPLYGLRGHTRIHLGPYTLPEAVEALGRAIGCGRTAAEPEAAERIVELLGRLPLAVGVAGAQLTAHPTARLARCADLVEQCVQENRLSELAAVGFDFNDRIDAVLGTLERCEGAAFRRLAAELDGAFTAEQSAAVLSVDSLTGGLLMVRLADAHLVEQVGETVSGERQYRFHALVGAYALEQHGSSGHRDARGGTPLPALFR
ncbi:BTAD domain-containing putative transcriptional regulator [Streptomyces sp. 8N706]|uniref:BTAD domain-containing putative transcriptional regulator n=1 Tax=Streptomyces sp. 8N706 TaxID=3457416 RepID=UPI003FD2CFBC